LHPEGRVQAGRQALVTGATGGIGRAVAELLAQQGADVALHYHRREAEAQALAEELARRHPGQRFLALGADVARPEEVAALFRRLGDAWGGLHVLVNNAGINRDRTLRKADPEEWRRVVEVDLMGVVHCTREALPYLRQPARVVNVSSIIGALGNFGQSNYAAAKAALFGFSKSLAQELGAQGTTVNVVAPGFVDTPMTAAMPEAYRRRWEERVPLRRFARPEEVAVCVAFLASEAASYVNGAILHVNGGAY
jgi:NAD(P)-dependent dehydrogenase (short-subunit alcohol dehydrogenase family)